VVKQYCARLRADEFKECKAIDNYHYVCKQNHPVQVTRLEEECGAEMLQSVRAIPASCSQRLLELNHPVQVTRLEEACGAEVLQSVRAIPASCSKRILELNHPVQVTRLEGECGAEVLQSVRAIPASCSQRILELNHTMWTQLNGNGWLFVAPKTDTLTVLCPSQEPTDIEILGTGKLKLENMCKVTVTRF
jgi:hypothetical protein